MLERIREILSRYQLTPTQFADAIGTARPIVSHILSGRNKPSLEVVQKIISAYPELSLPWLLSGTGPMEAGGTPTQPQASVPTTPSKASNKPTTARVASKQPLTAPQEVQALVAAPIPVLAPSVVEHPVSISQVSSEPQVVPVAQELPAPVGAPVESSKKAATAPGTPPASVAAFAEPGKAIRRIVIFYSDGTFTDYQPEAATV